MSLGLMEQDGESLQHLSGFLEATAAFLYAAATTKSAHLIDQALWPLGRGSAVNGAETESGWTK